MKRSILCILAVTLAMFASASPVMPEQAKQVARAWAQKNSAFGQRTVASGDAVPFTNEVTTLWYQVQMTDGSCLIVSPVTELEPVIAVLENVNAVEGLPEKHPMRAMLASDMKDRLTKLGLYRSASSSGGATLMGAPPPSGSTPEDPVLAAWAEQGKAKWGQFLSGGGPRLMAAKEQGVTDIEIQMGIVEGFEQDGRLTHWDQSSAGGGFCYNYHTPNHAVCGCVATMMSAIMQYFAVTSCPSNVRGVSPAKYNGSETDANGATFRTLGGFYDWSKFEDKTDRKAYDSLTDEQREILGRLAYDAGVAVGMAWTDRESGAVTLYVAEAFRTVFGFKDARSIDDPTEDQYAKLIYHQCMAGAPVGLSIHTEGQSGGHAVVAVGYGEDADGVPRTRIFTGWGGTGDGWYALPYINTKSLPSQSGSYLFDVVAGVVTMLGYDSDETVPVVGHLDAPGEAIEVPGAARTIYANEFGYFGTRVSPATTDWRLFCRGKEAQYEIGAGAAMKENKYIVDGDELCAALPEEIEFSLLNCSVAYTFAKAKAMALAEGKAILRVSGVTGGEATTNLLNYIYSLDDANEGDFTNKFVYFFSSAKSSVHGDGNPSISVFLPSDAEQSGRWQYVNGRLSYGFGYSAELEQTVTNDYEVAEEEMFYTITNEAFVATWGQLGTEQYAITNFPYTIPEGLTAMAELVLDNGWDEFCRRTHGISLTVASSTEETGVPDPTFGVHENTYTNGQEITAIAPDGLVTNDEKTVISEFGAWTLTVTNTVAGGAKTVKNGTGSEAVFTLASNDVATLVWKLEPKLMWISIVDDDDGFNECTTSPGTGWYPYGETVSFTATPGNGFAFDQWTSGTGDDLPYYLDSFRRQPTIFFRVEEPLSLVAYYNYGEPRPEEVSVTNQTLTVMSLYSDGEDGYYILDDDNLPKMSVTIFPVGGVHQVDGDIELPVASSATASIAAGAFTDEFGFEYKCLGWVLQDDESYATLAEGNGTITSKFVLDGQATLYWLWEPVVEEDPDEPEEPLEPADPPEGPDGGSPLTIYPNADGTLTVKAEIGNAVKGWWYVLRTAETVSGEYVPLSAEAAGDVCKKKADEEDEEGTLVLQSTFTPTEEKRFYKVSVEEEEP